MPLIKCEINLILTWSARCFIIDASIAGQEPTFTITDTKLHVPVLTLSTKDDAKLLQQLKSSFERTTNWNKYHPKVTLKQRNQYLDFLISASFVLSFENNCGRISYTRYYFPMLEIKGYNVMINGQNFFDQPVKIDLITYDNI